jgi:spermidine synthase
MRVAFAVIFAASGAAALIYEVTWTRLLTLQFGHGVAAASTVLAAFMGGLAIGSAAGGRVGGRLEPAAALRLYAALEVVIALMAVILPLGLAAMTPLLRTAYADGNGGVVFGLLRLTGSLVLLTLPATVMGATFPVASRWFVRHAALAARDAGGLYAANTVGAAIGAIAAGFVLLPQLGLSGATWVGVGANAMAAAGAWLVAAHPRAAGEAVAGTSVPPPAGRPAGVEPPASGRSPGTRRHHRRHRHANQVAISPGARGGRARGGLLPMATIAVAAFGLSGFMSLTAQVVWTRVLALIVGPTTYAFSSMVAIFIAGLALGAAMASRVAARARQPLVGLALCVGAAGIAAAVAATMVDRVLLASAAAIARPDTTFGDIVWRQASLAAALLAPMTIAFGAAFPFAVAAGTRSDDTVTTDLGRVYAVNTGGAILGALLAGFVVIPAMGLHGAIRLLALAGGLGALAVVMSGGVGRGARWTVAGVAAVAIASGIWLPPWDRLLLSSGGYKYAASLQAPELRTGLTAGELLYYKEGATGTVAVRSVGGTTSMAIDGKVDASNSGDMLTQRLLAHVPLLLHPNPQRVAILGLGSGVTLGSALRHPLRAADVLEISSQVVEASRFFTSENHAALADGRTRLIVGDGRTHLQLTSERYDVIVSEPSNPWMAGIATLFTREFMESARERLNPGGVLCQWAHTYDISTEDLQSIVATFLSVFPDGMLWLVGDGDVLLIGSNQPIEPRLAGMRDAWRRPGVSEDLAGVGALDPFHILSLFVAQGPDLTRWTQGASIQTDNRAALEFSGPRHALGRDDADNAAALRTLADTASKPDVVSATTAAASTALLRDRGWMLFGADAVRPAYDDLSRAAEADPKDARALEGLIRVSAQLRKGGETRALLTRLAADPTHQIAKLALSRFLASEGAFDEALRIPFNLLEDNPGNVPALEQMASILSDLADIERMRPVVARLRAEAPTSESSHYFSAALLFMEGRTELAITEARQVLAANPTHAKAQNLLGASLASQGLRDQARVAFQASLAADPKDPGTYTNLATLELQSGDYDKARRLFAEALTLDPSSETARRGLAELPRS